MRQGPNEKLIRAAAALPSPAFVCSFVGEFVRLCLIAGVCSSEAAAVLRPRPTPRLAGQLKQKYIKFHGDKNRNFLKYFCVYVGMHAEDAEKEGE